MLTEAIKNWADWGFAEEPTLIKKFDHGLNHHTGLIKSGNQKFVLKVFEHSFNKTIKTEYQASELEVAPRLYLAANNIAVYEFIDDQGFTPTQTESLAQNLRLTHQSNVKSTHMFNLLDFCESYLVNTSANAHEWHSTLLPVLNEFANDSTPYVFSHNDLVRENCLFSQDRALFIDWEFAQHNNPWFDLASIIVYFKLSEPQARAFLSSYQTGGDLTPDNRMCSVGKIAVWWCDLLWSLHTMGNDYWAQRPERFEELRKLALTLGITLAPKSD